MPQFAYLNDALVPAAELTISMNDLGFSRSYTAFELFRCYGDQPFLLDAHLARLARGLALLDITAPVTEQELRNMISTLIERHNFPESFFKIYVTAGAGDPSAQTIIGEPQLFLSQLPLTIESRAYPLGQAAYEPGLRLQTVTAERLLPEIKTTIYVAGFLQKKHAKHAGFDDILYIDRAGQVTESSTSNFFCVIDGQLVTPATGMLEGITRQHVLALAKDLGIPTIVRDLKQDELCTVNEAFVTSSVKEICPVSRIDDHELGNGKDFPITQKLRDAFLASLPS